VALGLAAAAPPSGEPAAGSAPALSAALAAPAAAAEPATPVAPAAAQTWRVDGVHSSIVFRVKHMGVANFYGTFGQFGGSIVLDEEDPSTSSVELTVQADSVDTRNAKRDQHAMSPDFLNAKEFPEISFKSTRIAAAGEGQWTLEGELTLHGVTQPVSATAELTGMVEGGKGGLAGFESRFEFKRSDFGMDNLLDALGDEVGVIVSLEVQSEG
jgi:polyisoprenoid-binding protein YceI